MFPMGPTLRSEFPEVKNFTRVRETQKVNINYNGKRVYLPAALWVDSTFLNMFDFKLLGGDRATALNKPNSALLTEEAAKKLFGDENPVGKTIARHSNDTVLFTVTGLLKAIPPNSHMQFDALFSFSTIFRPEMMNNWGGNWLVTYLELAPNANVAAMEKKLLISNDICQKTIGSIMSFFFNH
jgi:putative ABC transport system permease protein